MYRKQEGLSYAVLFPSVSYSRRRLGPLASSSPLPDFQSFHKKKKHSMGMGCHCCEWIALAAVRLHLGKGSTACLLCSKTREYVYPLMQTLTSWVVSAETFNLSVLLLP